MLLGNIKGIEFYHAVISEPKPDVAQELGRVKGRRR